MIDLFYMGGPLFMGMLSIILLSALVIAVINAKHVFGSGQQDKARIKNRIGYIRSLGLLAVVIGFLGQLIGLYSAFQFIEAGSEISPAILAGGLKVSSITTIYGLIIFVVCYLIWLLMDSRMGSAINEPHL